MTEIVAGSSRPARLIKPELEQLKAVDSDPEKVWELGTWKLPQRDGFPQYLTLASGRGNSVKTGKVLTVIDIYPSQQKDLVSPQAGPVSVFSLVHLSVLSPTLTPSSLLTAK